MATPRRTRGRTGVAVALAALTALVASLLTACTTETTVIAGSTVRVASAEPFITLNDRSRWGNTPANRTIASAVNSSLARYNTASELEFDESLGTAEVIDNNPFTVRYTVADTAYWSDGTRVSAADLLLAWAANSGRLNDPDFDPEPFINSDTGEWLRATPPGVVWFDGSVSEGLHHVPSAPTISDDGRSIDFEFDHYFVDWALVIHIGLPAHVVAQTALRIHDAHEARDALVDAILSNERGALAPIARTWNTGFTVDDLERDESLRVSNGPYVIADLVGGESVTLRANPHYRGTHQPRYETVIVETVGEASEVLDLLANDTVDVAVITPTPETMSALAGLDDVIVVEAHTASYSHLDLLMADSLNRDIENPLVREAFLHTIPVEEIAEVYAEAHGVTPQRRPSHLHLPGQSSAPPAAVRGVDIEHARDLLAEAGTPNPTICLLYDRASERRRSEYVLIRDSAAQAGIRVTDCGSSDWVGLLGTARSHDASLFTWNQRNHSVAALRATYGAGELVNYNRYSSDEAERILGRLELSPDPEKQAELRAELDTQLWEDHYGMPLHQEPLIVAVRDSVTGVQPTPLMRGILWNLSEWTPLHLNAPSPSP